MKIKLVGTSKCRLRLMDEGFESATAAKADAYQKIATRRIKGVVRPKNTRAGLTARELMRQKGTPYKELGLDDATLGDEALLDAMIAHPILIDRPLVVTPKGVRLCRPSERVIDLLPPQLGEFFKEDGMRIVDEKGRRVATA